MRRDRKAEKQEQQISDSEVSSSSEEDDDYMQQVLKIMKSLKKGKRSKRAKDRRSRSKAKRKRRSKSYRSRSKSQSSSNQTSDSEEDCRSRSRSRSKSRTHKHKKSRKDRGEDIFNTADEVAHNITLVEQIDKDEIQGVSQTSPNRPLYKSPSDTTAYAPAIACVGTSPQIKRKYTHKIKNNGTPDKGETLNIESQDNDNAIINFIKRIRLGESSSSGTSSSNQEKRAGVRSEVRVPELETSKKRNAEIDERSRAERARDDADNIIVQAEQYKAEIAPKGNDFISKLKQIVDSTVDDEFFHTTCHIESTIRDRIKKGEFVELEKLLIKRKGARPSDNGHHVEIVSRQGKTSIISNADKDARINNIYKWDQAFRVYATIYTQANPERSSEIWQYIDSIHRANRSFNWDAVAEYDYCFRQLMAEYPKRSWAKTYTQMWNLTLCESGTKQSHFSSNNKDNKEQGRKDWRDNTCWRYNKSKCNYGANCRFEHRCNYCASYNHPVQYCTKKNGQGGGSHRRSSDEREHKQRDHHKDKKKN